MRRLVTLTFLTAATVLWAASSTAARSELPLPAPITIEGPKVAYEIDRGEHVHLVKPRGWPFPERSACCAAPGVWFEISHKHLLVGRGPRPFWRSHNEYARAFDLGAVRFGAQTITFTYGSSLYLAPVGGAERVIGRSEVPLGFTAGGFYTYQWNQDLRLLSNTGKLVATLGRPLGRSTYMVTNGALYFMTNRDLVAAHGAAVTRLATWPALKLNPRSTWFQTVGSLIELEGARRLVLLRDDGSLFASTPLPRVHGHTQSLEGLIAPSPQLDAVAFAADSAPGRSGTETVYLLKAGASAAVPIHTERLTSQSCGQWAALAWHGEWLLYTNNAGTLDVIDTRGARRAINLAHLLGRLPGNSFPSAYWTGSPPPFWN